MRGLLLLLCLAACAAPRRYECPSAAAAPRIDGDLAEWSRVPWTEDFVDLASGEPVALRTRAKLQWDDRCLYVAAEMEEPHVWAELTEHDSVVYSDDDFEIFLDPSGAGRNYFELEVNAHGTVFDLLLVRPYHRGGPCVTGFGFKGLDIAVRVDGTINDPSDRDRGWAVELAIPWSAFEGVARPPRRGDRWRLDLSRVDWPMRIEKGRYVKSADTTKPLWQQPDNWVWAPTGVEDIHRPARWGILTFR